MFVDRVLYGGPDEQRLALGALAGATAVGALAVRVRRAGRASFRVVTLVGLAAEHRRPGRDGRLDAGDRHPRGRARRWPLFGLGFGLSVTPRSTAAVEAAGRAAFGAASSVVTVARMVGMAVGLAVLTAYGSTTIDRLSAEVYATPDAVPRLHPRGAAGSPVAGPAGRRGARDVGVARGRVDHGRAVPRRGGRDARGRPAGPRARRRTGRRRRGRREGAATDPRMLADDGSPDPGLIL